MHFICNATLVFCSEVGIWDFYHCTRISNPCTALYSSWSLVKKKSLFTNKIKVYHESFFLYYIPKSLNISRHFNSVQVGWQTLMLVVRVQFAFVAKVAVYVWHNS